MSPRIRNLLIFCFIPLFIYFSIYTWNWKTGVLDRLSTAVGLELAGWILSPGRLLQSNAESFWSRYVYLVGVRQENEDLLKKVGDLEQQLVALDEKAKSADRLATLLHFSPEAPWEKRGCRVIGQELGPSAVLESMLVDVGAADGVRANDPVVSTRGVVGRIAKPSAHFSTVLLLNDSTSRIPVLTSQGRVPAIVQGQGAGAYLEVKFLPRKDPVTPGEILISSGTGGVFPKGIPVARIVEVTPADVSLFQKVYAEPLLALRYYEELMVLSRREGMSTNATAGPQPVATVSNASVTVNASRQVQAAHTLPAEAVSTPGIQDREPATRLRVRKKP